MLSVASWKRSKTETVEHQCRRVSRIAVIIHDANAQSRRLGENGFSALTTSRCRAAIALTLLARREPNTVLVYPQQNPSVKMRATARLWKERSRITKCRGRNWRHDRRRQGGRRGPDASARELQPACTCDR